MPTQRDINKAKAKKEFLPTAIAAKEQAEKEKAEVWDESPPKQYVRIYAWLNVIQNYLYRRTNDGEEGAFRYLTFPGPNATDIGFLWRNGLIQKDANEKLNVAICDYEHAATVTINLSKVGQLLAASGDPFHHALKHDKLLIDKFPFDVINLDFTNHISLAPSTKPSKQNREAIGSVFRLQRGKSFMMLLTYRAIDDGASVNELLGIVGNNIQHEDAFRVAYQEQYGTIDPQECTKDLHKFNQLSYAKLIAKYARHFGYKTVDHFCGAYSRPDKQHKGKYYYMMVHSLEFEKITRGNPKNKYTTRDDYIPKDEWDELFHDKIPSYAIDAANKNYQEYITSLLKRPSIDVDVILKGDPALEVQLQEDADSLIEWWKKP